jgi:flavodoxin
LKAGNAVVMADMISSTVAVDVFRIEAADPYPDSYDATVERDARERNSEARPAVAGALRPSRPTTPCCWAAAYEGALLPLMTKEQS